jgi:hypothetical protein
VSGPALVVDSVTPDEPRSASIRWQVATVRDARAESPMARTLVLDVPAWPGHRAGHHAPSSCITGR